jgi:hypothetical protein
MSRAREGRGYKPLRAQLDRFFPKKVAPGLLSGSASG